MSLAATTRERLCSVFQRYDAVQAVYVFGSHAEGRANKCSDLDLAVVSSPGAEARTKRLDLLTDLADAGFDNVDLVFLGRDNTVLEHEAVRLNQLVFSRAGFDRGSYFSKVVRMYLDFVPLLRVQHSALKERLLHGAT